jgi:hypothetical protein
MAPPVRQDVLCAELARDAETLVRRARALAGEVSDQALRRPPPDGGWSAAQVFEHLVVANESYLVILRRVAASSPRPAAPDAAWRPSFVGGVLVRSFTSPRRMPAPRIYRPPEPRPNVIAAFAQGVEEMVGLMNRLAGADWRRVRTASPVTRWIRLNLGDCFPIIVRHAERHFRQIDRVLSSPGPSVTG